MPSPCLAIRCPVGTTISGSIILLLQPRLSPIYPPSCRTTSSSYGSCFSVSRINRGHPRARDPTATLSRRWCGIPVTAHNGIEHQPQRLAGSSPFASLRRCKQPRGFCSLGRGARCPHRLPAGAESKPNCLYLVMMLFSLTAGKQKRT